MGDGQIYKKSGLGQPPDALVNLWQDIGEAPPPPPPSCLTQIAQCQHRDYRGWLGVAKTHPANIFSHAVRYLFVSSMVFFAVQKHLSLRRSHLFLFAFISFVNICPPPRLTCVERCLIYVSLSPETLTGAFSPYSGSSIFMSQGNTSQSIKETISFSQTGS